MKLKPKARADRPNPTAYTLASALPIDRVYAVGFGLSARFIARNFTFSPPLLFDIQSIPRAAYPVNG
jgi:hypothetical protein